MGRNRKKNVFVSGSAAPIEEGFEPASLHIGGITICPPRISSQRGCRQGPAFQASGTTIPPPHQSNPPGPGSDDSSSSESSSEWSTDQEADMADYLENLGLHASTSDDMDEELLPSPSGLHGFQKTALKGKHATMDGAFLDMTLGSSSPPDSPRAPGGGPGTSAGGTRSGRGRRWSAAGKAPATNLSQRALEKMAAEEEVVQVQVDSDGNAVEEVRHVSTQEAFPCFIKPSQPRTPKNAHTGSDFEGGGPKRKKHKSGAKGAKGGKLAPGEKARLKHEKRQSKIAAREASRGFGVEREAARIMSFAAEEEEDEDMLACPPVGKHGQSVLVRIARMLGLRASVQGSGKKQMVMVVRPPGWHKQQQQQQQRPAALPQVQAFIAQELQRQRVGSAVAPSPSGNARQSGGPRWSGMPCAFRAETDGSGLGRPSFPNLATGATGGLNGGGSSGGFSGGVGLGGGSSSSASLRQPMRFVSAGLMVESGDLDGDEEGGVQVIGGGRPEGVKDNGRQGRKELMGSAGEEGVEEGKDEVALVAQELGAQQQQQQQQQQACTVALAEQMVDLSQAVLQEAQQQQQQQQLPPSNHPLQLQQQMQSAVAQLQLIRQLQQQQHKQQELQRQQQPTQQQENAELVSPAEGPPAGAAPSQQAGASAASAGGMRAGAAPTQGAEVGAASPQRMDDAATQGDGDSRMQVEAVPECGGTGQSGADGTVAESIGDNGRNPVGGVGGLRGSGEQLGASKSAMEGSLQGVQGMQGVGGVEGRVLGEQRVDQDTDDAEGLVKEMERSLFEGWMAGEDGGMGSGSEIDESDSTSGEGEGAEEEEEEEEEVEEGGGEEDFGGRGVRASHGGPGGIGQNAVEEEEEEEEEVQHRGLGFVSSADGHTYTRSNFSLGLKGSHAGLGVEGDSSGGGGAPQPSSTASFNPVLGLNQSVEPLIPAAPTESAPAAGTAAPAAVLPSKKEQRAAKRAQQASANRANLNNPNNPNFQGARAEAPSRAEAPHGMHPRDWANVNNPNHRSYQGLTRGQQVRQYQDAMLFGGIMPTSSQSVARGGPNQTKKQAKAASRKEAKDARRLLQRGGPGPHQMQEDREFGGDGGAYGAGGGGGIGRASNHASVAPAQLHYQFASFERHTSGIGSRLMESMGWSRGTGLGRVEQGRSEPLLPQRRPNKLGLGA